MRVTHPQLRDGAALAEVHGQVRLVFGLGFAVDGFSFFVEAIFISIYVYGWDRFSARVHFASGIPIITAGFTGSLTADLRQRLDEPPQLRFARSSRVSEQRPDRGDVNGFAVLKAKPGAAFRRAFWKRSRRFRRLSGWLSLRTRNRSGTYRAGGQGVGKATPTNSRRTKCREID